MKVSVIIPTLNAEKELPALLGALKRQTLDIDQILIVDSASNDNTAGICKADDKVRLLQISREEFDHGGTRDMALRCSKGDVVVFLTQDAMPYDDVFLERLIIPLSDPQVAVSTGRQLPKSDATNMERLVRAFNYPPESHIRSVDDIEKMGIKAFFSSDVCAAYNKAIYCEIGGFEQPVKTNEDMFYAAKALHNGYKIAYAADAIVLHSHNLSLKEQYKRNYIQGYEMEKHRDLLGEVSQNKEGIRLVKYVVKGLIKQKHPLSIGRFFFDCLARYTGNKEGRQAYNKTMGG